MALPPTNPPGLVRDAEDLNKVVNGDGTTNRAGDSLPSIKAVFERINDDFDAMQAGELTTQAVEAADRAETARDAAFINADVYPFVGAGRAAVEDDEQFQVIENAGRESVRYKRVNANEQEEVARFPTAIGVEHLTNRAQYGLITSLYDYPIKVDTVTKTIEVEGRAVGTKSSTVVPAGTTISYASLNSTVFLVVSPGPELGFYNDTQIRSLDSTHIIIASLMATRNHFQSPSNYMIDGVGSVYAKEVDRLTTGFVAGFYEDPIQINSANKTLTIRRQSRIYAGNKSFWIPEDIVYDYSGQVANLAIVASVEDGSVDFISPDLLKDIDYFSVLLGILVPNKNILLGVPNYSVDGYSNYAKKSVTPPSPPSGEGRVVPTLGWSLDGVYSAPEQETRLGRGIKIADIYGWFDELVAAHPDYVTKTLLGNEATGLPIYEYRFKPITSNNPDAETPRIMIQGGIHAEAMSLIMPYRAMRAICEDWENDPLLEALRFGVEFSVIPAVSPWGIENNSRYNSNDVNINRNYPQDWASSGDKPGSAPLSEIETQLSYGVMQEFNPHVFLDVHNFGTATTGEHKGAFLWFPPTGSVEGLWCGSALINRMARKWSTEHSWTTPTAKELSRNVALQTPGGAGVQGASMFPIGVTFETGSQILGEPDGFVYSPLSIKYAVESLINYIVIALRRIA